MGANAFDLGYEDQVLWNTLHGRPFDFSLLKGASFSLDYQAPSSVTDHILLGYHAELLAAPMSLLYAVVPDVRALLALQAVVVCAGGLAAYGLAARRLGSAWAALFVSLAYLCSPFLEAELLSDFHAVALDSALLMTLFYLIERRLAMVAIMVACVAVTAKEDAPAVVAMLGIWTAVGSRGIEYRQQRRLGVSLFVLGAVVAAFDLLWLIPHFSSVHASPFLKRYGYLGSRQRSLSVNLERLPGALSSTLLSPETLAYVRALVGSTAGLPLLAPATLAVAWPSLAINMLASFPWMRSGMAHYSALVLPVLIASSIESIRFVAAPGRFRVRRWKPLPSGNSVARRPITIVMAALLFCSAALSHFVLGQGPGGRAFGPTMPDAHARLLARFIAEIPAADAVSASSAIYPHLSHRAAIYLFPTILDANEVLVDLTTTPFPQQWSDQRQALINLLQSGEFGVVDAENGYVLLRKGAPDASLPIKALSFTEGPSTLANAPPLATFDASLSLLQARIEPSKTVGEPWAQTLTLDWRADQPMSEDVTLAVWGDAIPRPVPPDFDGDVPALVWLPTSNWQPGSVVRVVVPPVSVSSPGGMQVGWYRSDGRGHVTGWLRCVEASGRSCPLDSHEIIAPDPTRLPGPRRWLDGFGALWGEARSITQP